MYSFLQDLAILRFVIIIRFISGTKPIAKTRIKNTDKHTNTHKPIEKN